MSNQLNNLNQFGLVQVNDDELNENSGGWLILVALGLEYTALAIEVGSIALAGDMLLNPKRYTDAYKKGASGK